MNRFALALVSLLALGCASVTTALDPPPPARERLDALERRVLELEKQVIRDRLELEQLRQRVAELTAAAPAPGAPTAAPTAEPAPSAPGASAAEEAAAPAPPAPSAELEVSDLDEPVAPSSGSAAAAPSPPGTENGDYEAALGLLRDGHTAEAARALEEFARTYPGSDLGDNAWFWIGEARLALDDVAAATTAFRTAIEKYPSGNKVPDALFKLGHCLALQGDPAGAAQVWQEVVHRFPGTVAAERARERLGS